MEIQLIATYLIVLYAFGYTLYQFIKLFKRKKSSCEGSCGGCDFKNELKKRGKINLDGINNNLTYIKE